jgi:HAD superfamily hydrolase (TIGR01549 family)
VLTTVLCDLDGTLVDSRQDIGTAFQHALRLVTADVPDVASIARHIGKPLEQMLRDLGYRLPPEAVATFLTAYRHYYATQGLPYTRPFADVLPTLAALTTITFGVVTTKEQTQAEFVLQRLQLGRFFRHVQGWQPGLRLKPAPDTVVAALAALRCAPQHALMVGDTPADIMAGKDAGVRTCAVTYGCGTRQELQQCEPTYLIDTFGALSVLIARESYEGPGQPGVTGSNRALSR